MRLLILTTVIFLCGCASFSDYYAENHCNTDAAYAAGVNDAKNSNDMSSNYASWCPDNKAQLNAAYRRGYEFALSSTRTPISISFGT